MARKEKQPALGNTAEVNETEATIDEAELQEEEAEEIQTGIPVETFKPKFPEKRVVRRPSPENCMVQANTSIPDMEDETGIQWNDMENKPLLNKNFLFKILKSYTDKQVSYLAGQYVGDGCRFPGVGWKPLPLILGWAPDDQENNLLLDKYYDHQ